MSRSVDRFSSHSSMNDPVALTDEQLISAFIDGVVRGDRPLQSNKNLRIEPIFQSLQLFSNREGIVATVDLKKIPTQIDVRQGTEYWQQVHDKLFEHCYLPYANSNSGDTYQYRYCNLPEGYKLYCTTAKELWRASWGRGFGLRSGIPLDLIVWQPREGSRQSWQSLVGMDCDRGKLVIKMLGQAVALDSTDLVVWAKAIIATPRIRSQVYRESLRHHRY